MRLAELRDAIDLREIGSLDRRQQERILAIRNQAGVRKNMYTDHLITSDEHFAWIDRLASDDRTKFYAVVDDGEVVGGISLNAISRPNKRADWAFYLDEATQGKGLGSALEFRFLDQAFGPEGLEKLNCEVLAFNQPVIKLHKKFGFVEEGIRRDHIIRDSEKHDAYLLGITSTEWAARREELAKGVFR